MALPLGKLTILVGAGILGSFLAKEGRLSDFVSGAFKQIQQDDASPPVNKPRNDTLIDQVNSLWKELQLLASSRSMTIVNASQSGGKKYGVIVVVVVVGYGYVWWKGWKLPDMMFATRRCLADACTCISKQLESVYSSIARFCSRLRRLSSQIDGLDCNLNECLENSTKTRQEISELCGKTNTIGLGVTNVHNAVQELETRINKIEENQDKTNKGMDWLCDVAWRMENSKTTDRIQASASRRTPELPPVSPSSSVNPSSSSWPALYTSPSSPSRTGSLPSVSISELASPDSVGS